MKDLTGQRFGRLVCVKPTEKRFYTHVIWECMCDCGNIHYAPAARLMIGDVKSCGCLNKEIQFNRKEERTILICKNILNGKLRKNNHSGVTGVFFDNSKNKWIAYITVNRKRHRLGTFSKFEDAVKVRKSAEWMLEEHIENLEEELFKLKEGVSK